MEASGNFDWVEKFRSRYAHSEKKVTHKMDLADLPPTSLSEKKKERERARPVKIRELLSSSERKQYSTSTSVRKRLPERLKYTEIDDVISRGKQGRENQSHLGIKAKRKLDLTTTPKQPNQINVKQADINCTNKHDHTVSTKSNISRYTMVATTEKLRQPMNNKAKDYTKAQDTNTTVNRPNNRKSFLPQRKSMLLPPNSIKNKHTAKENIKRRLSVRNKKSIAPNTVKKCSDIFEESTVAGDPTEHDKDNHRDNHIETKKSSVVMEPITSHFQKNDILYIKSNLQYLISRTEEDLNNLKEMLKRVEGMMHVNSVDVCTAKSESNSSESSEGGRQEVPPVNNEAEQEATLVKEVTEEVKTNDDIQIDVCNNEKLDEAVKKTEESHDVNHNEDDKENCNIDSVVDSGKKENIHSAPRRRSARLQKLQAINSQDDSFLNLEDELNIVHAKSMPNTSRQILTPAKNKSKLHEKSLYEYMTLKSSISFLQTPDAKNFQSRIDRNDESAATNIIKSSISKNLLRELRELCTESPM